MKLATSVVAVVAVVTIVTELDSIILLTAIVRISQKRYSAAGINFLQPLSA